MERKIHERKKRYGRLLVVAAINWALIGLMIWKVDPELIRDFFFPGSYLPMTLLLAGGIFWLLSILFMSSRRAARWTVGIMVFLFLRIWGLGSMLNALLIFGLLLISEIYLHKEKKRPAADSDITLNK